MAASDMPDNSDLGRRTPNRGTRRLSHDEVRAYLNERCPNDEESLFRYFNYDPNHEYTEEEWQSLEGKPDFVPDEAWRGMHPCLRPLTTEEVWRELLRPRTCNRLDGDPDPPDRGTGTPR